MLSVTREQASRFLLRKNGLLGPRLFAGKDGVCDYVYQAGCVPVDTVDVCGMSHELAILARVRGFSRPMLNELLYTDRALIDHVDKNMCIVCAEDWPELAFWRDRFRTGASGPDEETLARVLHLVREKGSLSVQELEAMGEELPARSALKTLFYRGDVVIHHKTGTQKSYAAAEDCLPRELLEAPQPFATDFERLLWQVMRRIRGVGLLWNAASDAWFGVEGLTPSVRGQVFAMLEEMRVIVPVEVDEVSTPLYLPTEDLPLLKDSLRAGPPSRSVRLLPPLDCLLWDRRLAIALFDFSYKWEINMPADQRRYGAYVLPVLCGERFLGRIEPVADYENDVLTVQAFWPEEDADITNRILWDVEDELARLARFLGLKRVAWAQGWERGGH